MKKHAAILMVVLTISLMGMSQKTLDKSIQFPPGGGFINYHIYEPSGLDVNVPHKMIVGFHPFNTSRWDGESWRDTLITFAENANLLLICPDGGPDGRIDGEADFDFIEAITDSMRNWYNVDTNGLYAIGFSVGGKAVYEYALKHRSEYKGLIPVGAAISDTDYVDDIIHRGRCQNYHIVHGKQDSPNTRYYPMKDGLERNGANVEVSFMGGVGHTFDFPSRNTIILRAFRYVDTASCNYTGVGRVSENVIGRIYPSLITKGENIVLDLDINRISGTLSFYDLKGAIYKSQDLIITESKTKFSTKDFEPGVYIVRFEGNEGTVQQRILIQ